MALVLGRRKGETLAIELPNGDIIDLRVIAASGSNCIFSINAPNNVHIYRDHVKRNESLRTMAYEDKKHKFYETFDEAQKSECLCLIPKTIDYDSHKLIWDLANYSAQIKVKTLDESKKAQEYDCEIKD